MTLLTDGLMQIGWADAAYKGDPDRGQGVGDHPHSWALDGYRCKRWNGSSEEYGVRWRIGDVVGCLLDLDTMQMRFYLNGDDLGIAYTDFSGGIHGGGGGLYPAVSLNMSQSARFNFGPPFGDFIFPPVDVSYRSVGEAFMISISALADGRNNVDVSAPSSPKNNSSSSSMLNNGENDGAGAGGSSGSGGGGGGSSSGGQGVGDDGNASTSGETKDVHQDEEDDDGEEEEELGRQQMIDNLIGMGFPVEWCVRAANHHYEDSLDESSAIAWIIEQMEMDSVNKEDDLDEDDEEEDEEGEEDDEDDEEEGGRRRGGGGRGSERHHLLDDDAYMEAYDNADIAEHFEYLSSAIHRRMMNVEGEEDDDDDDDEVGDGGGSGSGSGGHRGHRHHHHHGDDHHDGEDDDESDEDDSRLGGEGTTSRSNNDSTGGSGGGGGGTSVSVSLHAASGSAIGMHNPRSGNMSSLHHQFSRSLRTSNSSPLGGGGGGGGGGGVGRTSDSYEQEEEENIDAHLIEEEECDELYMSTANRYFDLSARGGGSTTGGVSNGGLTSSGGGSGRGGSGQVSDSGSSGGGGGGIGGSGNYTHEHNSVVSLLEFAQGRTGATRTSSSSSGGGGASSSSLRFSSANKDTGAIRGERSGAAGESLYGHVGRDGGVATSEPLHYLAQTNDLQELWGLGSSTCAALSVLYARSAVVSLLSLGKSRPTTSGARLAEELQRPRCILMFLDFLKLVRYRGPLLHLGSGDGGGRGRGRGGGGKDKTSNKFAEDEKNALITTDAAAGAADMLVTDNMYEVLTPFVKMLMTAAYPGVSGGDPDMDVPSSDSSAAGGATAGNAASNVAGNVADHIASADDVSAAAASAAAAALVAASNKKTPHMLFLTVLLDESLSHMSRAKSREFDRMLWLSSPSTHVHPFASSVLTLTCDSDALVQPNPLWAAWALNAIMDEADNDVNSSISVPSSLSFVGTTIHGPSSDNDLISSDVFSADVFTSLMQCAQTPNMALKEILFRLATRVLSKVLRALEADTEVLSLQEMHQYLTACRHAQLIRVFSTRMRKEHSIGAASSLGLEGGAAANVADSVASAAASAVASAAISAAANAAANAAASAAASAIGAIHSSYLHVLTSLLVRIDCLRAHTWSGEHHRRGTLRYRALGSTGGSILGSNGGAIGGATSVTESKGAGMPTLFLDDVTATSITIGWWLDPEWVGALSDQETSIEIQVEMAQVVFDDHPSRMSGMMSLEYAPAKNGVITPVVEYHTNPLTGVTRPRTISTMTCSDLDPDSRYVFRLTGTTTTEIHREEEKDDEKKDDEKKDDEKKDDEEDESLVGEKTTKSVTTTKDTPTVSFGLISSAAAAALQPLRRSNALTAETLCEMLFMLDPTSLGPNLVLSNGNLVVTNTVNKKWNAVRATASFSSGMHSWEVHIDKCVSKNIFVGVITAAGACDNYVGSDRYGWGYLANKAIWHNKGKMRSYGELFRQGDTIGVRLDMDVGTLSFTRNGKDLGVAVEGLVGDVFPAFSLYNQDDQLSMSAGGNRSKGRSGASSSMASLNSLNGGLEDDDTKRESGIHSEGSLARRKLHRLNQSTRILRALNSKKILMSTTTPSSSSSLPSSLPEVVTVDELSEFSNIWKRGAMTRAITSEGEIVVLDGDKCSEFGYARGDILCTSKGDVLVLGVDQGMLYTRMSEHSGTLGSDHLEEKVPSPKNSSSGGGGSSSGDSSSNSTSSSGDSSSSGGPSSSDNLLSSTESRQNKKSSDDTFTSSSRYLVTSWTRKAVREMRMMAPASSLAGKNIGSGPSKDKIDKEESEEGTSTSTSTSSSARSAANASASSTVSSAMSAQQWWSNDDTHDDIIMQILNELTMKTFAAPSYRGSCPWNVCEAEVHSALIKKGIQVSDLLLLRILSVVYTNHLLESVLPLVEIWRDGTSLSASGWTPTAAANSASSGWCPQPWSLGALLISSKHLIMTATKYRYLCTLLARTCTSSHFHGNDTKNKIAQLMTIEKSTMEIVTPSSLLATTRSGGMSEMSGMSGHDKSKTYFAQCCSLLPLLHTHALRYGDGTKETYCVRVRFRAGSSGAGQSTSPHFSSIQGQDHLHDWRKYQQELFKHVANDINQLRSGIFIRGRGSTTALPVLIPAPPTPGSAYTTADKTAFKCIGWMLGVAVRTRTSFALHLAPFLWKILLNPTEKLLKDDLAPLDTSGALEYLVSKEWKNSSVVNNMMMMKGEEKVESSRKNNLQSGATITAMNTSHVRPIILRLRLERARAAMSDVRSGLLDIIPGNSLALFTWTEMRSIVAGGGKK